MYIYCKIYNIIQYLYESDSIDTRDVYNIHKLFTEKL